MSAYGKVKADPCIIDDIKHIYNEVYTICIVAQPCMSKYCCHIPPLIENNYDQLIEHTLMTYYALFCNMLTAVIVHKHGWICNFVDLYGIFW